MRRETAALLADLLEGTVREYRRAGDPKVFLEAVVDALPQIADKFVVALRAIADVETKEEKQATE